MSLFTRENAAEMARRSVLARKAAQQAPAPIPVQEDDKADVIRRQMLGVQIELLDKHIAKAKKPDDVCNLIAAKERLWKLLYPAEPRAPGRGGPRSPGAQIQRGPIQPIAPTSPLVVSTPPENHKSETNPSQVAA